MRKGVLVVVAALALVGSGCTAPAWASLPAMSDQIPLPIDARFTPTPERPPPAQVTADLPDLGGSSSVYALCRTLADQECGGALIPEPGDTAGLLDDGTRDIVIEVSAVSRRTVPNPGARVIRQPIARDAFVFVTHRDNPVTGLSLQQVRDIYSGTITNWKEVGGRDEAILAFQRRAGTGSVTYDDAPSFQLAGSQDAMVAWVMDGAQLMPELTASERHGSQNWDTTAEYRNLPAALGYTFRWHAAVLNADPQVKLLTVDGVDPTDANLVSGRYPLTIEVTAVIRKSPAAKVNRFLAWVTGPDGRALIRRAGYAA
ncbi:MAG: substrate-binding domain-containing protein [Micropruina sp.]